MPLSVQTHYGTMYDAQHNNIRTYSRIEHAYTRLRAYMCMYVCIYVCILHMYIQCATMPSVHRRVYWLGLAPTYYDFSFLRWRFICFFFLLFLCSPGKGGTRLDPDHMSIKGKEGCPVRGKDRWQQGKRRGKMCTAMTIRIFR